MKTIIQWLEELPEPYRTQALENLDLKYSETKVSRLSSAVFNGFGWEKSPQGFEYWDKLFDDLVEKNNLVDKE